VWGVIDKNLHALLTFFDTLLTRDKLPYLQYWETFATPKQGLPEMLGSVLVPVKVDRPLYETILQQLAAQISATAFNKVPAGLVAEVEHELAAFQYDWRPGFGLLNVPPQYFSAAQFMLGGLIFSAYAQTTGSDHLVQGKRSRLLLALSAPDAESIAWSAQKERELFAAFKQHCSETGKNIRADDFNTAPSVVPYLLKEEPVPKHSQDLLDKCLALREKSLGRDYRDWFRKLRIAWAQGTHDEQAEKSATVVLSELRRRIGAGVPTGNGLKVDIEVSLSHCHRGLRLTPRLQRRTSMSAFHNGFEPGWSII
jgi:hypothetical protein